MSVQYSCSALRGTGKKGVVRTDANGYTEMVLGGFNTFNSAGEFYSFEETRALFENSSSLMRRINNGQCRGEYGHPKRVTGMTNEAYLSRVLSIAEENISHHVKAIRLDTTGYRDEHGKSIVAVIGLVKPCGPKGTVLAASMENADENVAFSIRSLTNNEYKGGIMHKAVKVIVGWDYVNEGGISIANKYQSPGLEDFSEDQTVFTRSTLDLIEAKPVFAGAMESGGISPLMVRGELGWVRTQNLTATPLSW